MKIKGAALTEYCLLVAAFLFLLVVFTPTSKLRPLADWMDRQPPPFPAYRGGGGVQ